VTWRRKTKRKELLRSERVVAMRNGTRNENATRLWGDIGIDVNEDKVAPWKVDVDGGLGFWLRGTLAC
jgi:hypothetical protein